MSEQSKVAAGPPSGGVLHSGGNVMPIPDPTALTTEALRRDVQALRELLAAEAHGQKIVFETRFAAMDNAQALIQRYLDTRDNIIDGKVNTLRVLHEEKFKSIQTQFTERDTRTEQTSRDSKVAVDAALQAAKEAVGEQNKSSSLAISKSEASTSKQIDQQAQLITSSTKGLDDKISDIKERVTSLESRGVGVAKGHDDGRAVMAMAVSIIMAFVGVASFVMSRLH